MNKFYIGIGGMARSGKDTCGAIIYNLLKKNRFNPQKFSLADELKNDVKEFLNIKCNSDPYTDDLEEKTKIRPFLVWYGCYKRDCEPDYWIKQIEKNIDNNPSCNVVICTDLRFKNEVDWIHSKNGWVIHLTKYNKVSSDGGRTWERKYPSPPNEEEKLNDPIISGMADYKIIWEDLSSNGLYRISIDQIINEPYLKEEVYQSVKSCPYFSNKLIHH